MNHKNKIDILFVIPNLDGGGAQKTFVNILNQLDKNIFNPKLIIFDTSNAIFLSEVSKKVEIFDLKCKRVRFGIFKIYKFINENNPDIVISTLTQINLPLSLIKFLLPKKIIFIAREANIVSENIKRYKFPIIWKILYKLLYNLFDAIICISKYQLDDLIDNFGIKKKKIILIYNPINLEKINKLSNQKILNQKYQIFNKRKNFVYLVASGTLSFQKGFELLIDAINIVRNENIHLSILGSGPLKNSLKKRIEQKNLSNIIELVGFQKNPYIWFKNADFFVLSSLYEGLGNVTLESLACKTPVLAVPSVGSTFEILKKVKGCYISDELNSASLAALIKKNLNKKNKIKSFVAKKYDSKLIVTEYENLFLQLLNQNKI